ncbi:glycosyltransferase family 2 protein [Novosphingobium pentaromativorans]|uniref:glycosyltransferase family 2 protein n=1 Tax=Novosphingobium pentaromativorans TaxID=205844 RepID=UPI00051F81E0|nr:glycosyltransferase family A protein [Novosphingobium pentaromativorans]AIT79490.1 glycosyl transferase [Novosphingobium pentaromativorans US6-1]
MTDRAEKVTLSLPVFNGSDYIADAIESILGQTLTDFRLYVTDNASHDDTPEIVSSYARKDSRVVLVSNKENIGAAANYNLGFTYRAGKYFKWCAHDDRLSPNYLEACVDALEARPDVGLAYGRTLQISPKDEIFEIPEYETPSIDNDDPAQRFRQTIALSKTCFPIFGVFRPELLERSMLHRSYYGSDRALLAEMAILGKFLLVEDAVFYNREHEERSINIDDKLQRSLWQTGRKSRSAAAEHIQLASHLFRIASRHGDVVAPYRLWAGLIRRSLTPVELGRYSLELAGMISPKMAAFLKRNFAGQIGPRQLKQVVFK